MSSNIPLALKKFSVIIPKGTILSTYVSKNFESPLGYYLTYYTSNLNDMYQKEGMFFKKCTMYQEFFEVTNDLELINLPYIPDDDSNFKLCKIYLEFVNYIDSHYDDIKNYIIEKNLFNYKTVDTTLQKILVDKFISLGKQELLNTINSSIISVKSCIKYFEEESYCDIFKNENKLLDHSRIEAMMSLLFNSLNLNGWVRFYGNYINSADELNERNTESPQFGDEIYITKSNFINLRSLKKIECTPDTRLQYAAYVEIITQLKKDPVTFLQPKIKFYKNNNYEQKYLKYKRKYLHLKNT